MAARMWVSICLKSRYQCVVVHGEKSESINVYLGVPQGTVLGPLYFPSVSMTDYSLVIASSPKEGNDLPDIVTSTTSRFADDCLVYRIIRTIEDQIALHKD